MAVLGVGMISAGELTGTFQTEEQSPVGATKNKPPFQEADNAAPPRPKRSMLQRIGDFFSSLGKSFSKRLPSFLPSEPSAKYEQAVQKLNAVNAELAEAKQAGNKAKATYDEGMSKIKAMGAEIAEGKKELMDRRKKNNSQRMSTGKNDGIGQPQKPPKDATAAVKNRASAAETEAAFPANGVTLKKLISNINDLQGMIPGSRKFSAETQKTIVQSPKLMAHLKDFANNGFRIEIKPDADGGAIPTNPTDIVSKSDKKIYLSQNAMAHDGPQFLDDFAEALMLAKVDALGLSDEFGGDHFQNVITDLPIIKKEFAGVD